MSRAARIAQLLSASFPGDAVEVVDESHGHLGHAGHDPRGSHFRVIVTSNWFVGLSRPARHRLVYDALASMFPTDIHALSAELRTPDEAAAQKPTLPSQPSGT